MCLCLYYVCLHPSIDLYGGLYHFRQIKINRGEIGEKLPDNPLSIALFLWTLEYHPDFLTCVIVPERVSLQLMKLRLHDRVVRNHLPTLISETISGVNKIFTY